jgi:uncharacterized membrane protein
MIDRRETWKFAGKCVFAVLFLAVGVTHFTRTDFLMKAMPDYLPYHRELVLISGVFEIALGILLLVPPTSRLAAWGLIALLIAVFPANITMYQHPERFPYPPILLLLRLPLQIVLLLWAYAYTRRPPEKPANPEL